METELKFQVPSACRAAVERAVATTTAQRTRLRAAYADTADARLARAGLALRLRLEGRRWVQTLKGRGDSPAERLEHEVPLVRRPALPDPALHAGTPVGARLTAALAAPDGPLPLVERFATDIVRTHRVLRLPGGALVELAFDAGFITAGGHRHAVCELEFELLKGPLDALLVLAERWVQRHGLWLDVRTKSDIGHRLAEGLATVPAVTAALVGQPALTRSMAPAEAFERTITASLQHVLPNQAELASDGVSGAAREAHLHQWRVAVRRLRTALRVLGAWSAGALDSAALDERWAACFAATSAARDGDVMAALLAAPLAEAGLAPLPGGAADAAALAAVSPSAFRSPDLTVLVLHTLRAASASTSPPATPEPEADLRGAARARLRHAAKKPWPRLQAFDALSIDERHRLRKQLKRLRYATELLGALLPQRALARSTRRLRDAVEALGRCNDLAVAMSRLEPASAAPAATAASTAATADAIWFARGWSLGVRAQLDGEARRALRRLAKSRPVWR